MNNEQNLYYPNAFPNNNSNSVTLGKIASTTDQIINEKFPQISRTIRYPLRNKQFSLYANVLQKFLKKARRKNNELTNPIINEEKKNLASFYNKANEYGQQQMKEYLLVNQQKNHSIPEIIQRSLFTLKLYDKIPIVNKKLMAPYDDINNWKKGRLKCLNTKILKNTLSSMLTFSDFNKLPQYKILSQYIKNPSKLSQITKQINKENANLRNPKKLASKIANIISKDDYKLNTNTSTGYNLSPAYYQSYLNMQNTSIDPFSYNNLDAANKLKKLIIKENFNIN
jgi:hypothetical protein